MFEWIRRLVEFERRRREREMQDRGCIDLAVAADQMEPTLESLERTLAGHEQRIDSLERQREIETWRRQRRGDRPA